MGRRFDRWLNAETRGGWLRRLSDRAAEGLDAMPGMTPNHVTAAGLSFALLATLLFSVGGVGLGALFCAMSYLTDFLDGALARYQDARMTPEDRAAEGAKHWMLRRGKTEDGAIFSGAAFDPFVDKVRYFGALLPLGLGRLPAWLIAAAGVFALALTIGRPIVAKMRLSKGKANWFGKHKVHVEAVLVAWLVLVPAATLAHVDDVLLALATLGGAASFISQAHTAWRARKDAKAPA
jgi:phosphatidylglycerophosphate synthase